MSSPPAPDANAIREALEAIVTSPGFANSDRMARFLRYVVEKSLAGDADQIKEYALGTDVFDRDASFDPKADTIVRVEARRLRRKLAEYYEAAGRDAKVMIQIPSPGYAPSFAVVEKSAVAMAPAAVKPFRPRAWQWVSLLLLITAAASAYVWFRREPPANLRSVAVLPFANLSGDPNQEYFSDGFTEEVIDRLTSIDGLKVAARTSSFEFKNKARDVRVIGRELDVDAMVEGSIRRGGNTIRITAQLVRASDGYHVWSKTWDRPATDVLAVETEVASAIAESLAQTLSASKATLPSFEAHDLYLLGRYHWNTLEPADMFKAIGYFEKAVERDPNYALAYSGLSEAYSYLIDLDAAPLASMAPKARAAAEKALALDPNLAEAHTSLGLVLMDAEWDFAGAEKEFRRAIELKPRFAYGVHWMAHYLENRNRLDEGCSEMKRAADLDPLARIYRADFALCLFKQRNFAAARAELDHSRELDPGWPLFDAAQGMLELANHQPGKAIASATRAGKVLGPIPMVVVTLASAYRQEGNQKAAAAELERLEGISKKEYMPAYALALANYAAGKRDAGFALMQRAARDHNAALLWLGNSPWFDDARQDPRARQLLDKIPSVDH